MWERIRLLNVAIIGIEAEIWGNESHVHPVQHVGDVDVTPDTPNCCGAYRIIASNKERTEIRIENET
jgi:hypothetical protein